MVVILLSLAFLIPLAYTPFFLPFGYESAFELKRTILETGALALCAVWAFQKKSKALTKAMPWTIFLAVIYVGYLALNAMILAPGGIAGRELYEATCLLLIFLSAASMANEPSFRFKIFQILCLAGNIAALFALVQSWNGQEPFSTLGNRNFVATVMLFTIPTSVYLGARALQEQQSRFVLMHALGLGLGLATLVICKSKAAWISLMAGGILFLALRKDFKTVGIVFLLGALGFSFLPLEFIVTELYRDVRPFLWEGAWRMGMSAPLFGLGLGQFFIRAPIFRSREYFLMDKASDTTIHAHNEFLQIFSETGVMGLLLFILVISSVFIPLLKRVHRERATGMPALLLILLTSMVIKIFFDMDLGTISSAFLFWLLLGLSVGDAPPRWIMPSIPGWNRVLVLGLAVLLFWDYSVSFARVEWKLKQAVRNERDGRWHEAQTLYREMLRIEPSNANLAFRQGYSYAMTQEWDEAMESYHLVRESAPFYSDVVFNMAAITRHRGDYDGAMEFLREGFSINPYHIVGHNIAREIFLLTGQPGMAKREEQVLRAIYQQKKTQRGE